MVARLGSKRLCQQEPDLRMESRFVSAVLIASASLLLASLVPATEPGDASLGRKIFLDTGLSQPPGQGCITCHRPSSAFADPRPVSLGAVAGRAGRRNAPTLMYASLIPSRVLEEFYDADGIQSFLTEGGLFHDGRARDQFQQVQKPFFDPDEMNLSGRLLSPRSCGHPPMLTSWRHWLGRLGGTTTGKSLFTPIGHWSSFSRNRCSARSTRGSMIFSRETRML